jgi:hypothetical protein
MQLANPFINEKKKITRAARIKNYIFFFKKKE